MRPKILVIADWYVPGRKAGGLVSAVANLIELLGDEFSFHVITRDRDLEDKNAYSDVPSDHWLTVGKANVLYTSNLSFSNLRRRILEVSPQIVYLNSFFSLLTRKILLLRRLGLLSWCALVVAPRGEFAPGAFRLKRFRKCLYKKMTTHAGLYQGVIWQASSELEKQQIAASGIDKGVRNSGRLLVATDVPSHNLLEMPQKSRRPEKRPGAVHLIFLSRISRKKNLHFALEALASVEGDVMFNIVGPIEDAKYWSECQEQIRGLPRNISVRCAGPVSQEHVRNAFLRHQFLLLPTLGENFGYAILESLATGCPVLISDQTPWRDLHSVGAGWDLPLGRPQLWRNAIQECVAMDEEAYHSASQRARRFAEKWLSSCSYRRESTSLFEAALAYAQAEQMMGSNSRF